MNFLDFQESLPKDGNRYPMKRQRLNDYARKMTEIKRWCRASDVQREMARLVGEGGRALVEGVHCKTVELVNPGQLANICRTSDAPSFLVFKFRCHRRLRGLV
jgi:hypothetical protein